MEARGLHRRKEMPGMIYITGDCHQDFRRFDTENFPEQKEMTKEDFCVICGDFGGVWDRNKESKTEKYLMDWLESRSFTLLFVDGNHENFDRLYAYPEEEWHGGRVHRIRPSVIHLMRGQIYDIGGASFFTFGGAGSHDISGGLLDPEAPGYKTEKRKLDQRHLPYRIRHISWWEQELPTDREMEEGLTNLAAHGSRVDFIVTHCCASSTQALIGGGLYKPDRLTAYLEEVKQSVKFRKWFFGHYHDNRMVSAQEILLYEQIGRIR